MHRSIAAIASLACFAIAPPALAEQPPAPAPAAQPNPKLDDIRKLLTLMGQAKIGQQVLDQMIPAMKESVPHVPAGFWEGFRKEAKPDELFERLVILYDKHFTPSEIKELVAFYESPVGKKLVAQMPVVNREFVAAQQAWTQALAEKVSSKLGVSEARHGK
jgi:hypothetical protein